MSLHEQSICKKKKEKINFKSNLHPITNNMHFVHNIVARVFFSWFCFIFSFPLFSTHILNWIEHCSNFYSIVYCRVMKYTISRHIHNILCHYKCLIQRDLGQPQLFSWWLTKGVSALFFHICCSFNLCQKRTTVYVNDGSTLCTEKFYLSYTCDSYFDWAILTISFNLSMHIIYFQIRWNIIIEAILLKLTY